MQVLSAATFPPVVWPRTEKRAAYQPIRAQRRQHGIRLPAELGIEISHQSMHTSERENRIRLQLLGAKHQPSSYDTAWVAMVPAQGVPQAPRFPRFVEWILQNQKDDGSWGLGHLDPNSLGKDAISSTLACILALKKWNVGDEHIRKGLHFIVNNSSCITDENCDTPVGFNIIFSGMIMFGMGLGLQFPFRQSDLDGIFRLREMELQRNMASERKARMAYVAEGLGDTNDWDQLLIYQSKNGSLFNSPSATSALAIHRQDTNALKYLDELGNKFSSSVPIAYPMSIYSKLCMVDTLEKMGISSNFSQEINCILDMTYMSWLQKEEEIIMDMETCALAFRILRMHGYNVSSDVFSHFAEETRFHNSVQGHLTDTKTLLELYNASQVRILEEEWALENIGSWTSKLLKQQLNSNRLSRSVMSQEVEYALKLPFHSATIELLEHKRNIEHFSTKSIKMRKSAYLVSEATEDTLALAIEEFSLSQSLHQQELRCIESWVKEVGLDNLDFARNIPLNIYVFLASTVFPLKFPEARNAWIKNCFLTTAIDDFFDDGGSTEELKNLTALIEKWDAHNEIGFCSEQVEILFSAVYRTNSQIGAKAAEVQNRQVIGHIAQHWLDYLKANMMEAEWTRKRYVPTMEEYMPVAEASIAMGPILATSLYLVGPEISKDKTNDPAYKELLGLMSICCRLLNDLGTYKKERSQGYINSVLLCALRDRGSTSSASIEAAKMEIWRGIVASRSELLRAVLRESSTIPRLLREIVWNMCKVSHLFYLQVYDFRSLQELVASGGSRPEINPVGFKDEQFYSTK